MCPIPSDSPGAETKSRRSGEESSGSCHGRSQGSPIRRRGFLGEAARGKPRFAGPSERHAHIGRPPPRGSYGGRGEEAGAALRPPPRAAPRQPRGGCCQKPPLPPQSRSQSRGSTRSRPAAPPRFASGLVNALVRQAAQLSDQPSVRSRQPQLHARFASRAAGPSHRPAAPPPAPRPRLDCSSALCAAAARPAPRHEGERRSLGLDHARGEAGPGKREGPLCMMSLWAWPGGGGSWAWLGVAGMTPGFSDPRFREE